MTRTSLAGCGLFQKNIQQQGPRINPWFEAYPRKSYVVTLHTKPSALFMCGGLTALLGRILLPRLSSYEKKAG